MKSTNKKWIKLFLRLSIGAGFLSAVADRFGMWPDQFSAWGNWESFLEYTAMLMPWLSDSMVSAAGIIATALEIILGIMLILGIKTRLAANVSGLLLLAFALSMAFFTGVKRPLDASVFTASAASFALAMIHEKFWELDGFFKSKR